MLSDSNYLAWLDYQLELRTLQGCCSTFRSSDVRVVIPPLLCVDSKQDFPSASGLDADINVVTRACHAISALSTRQIGALDLHGPVFEYFVQGTACDADLDTLQVDARAMGCAVGAARQVHLPSWQCT